MANVDQIHTFRAWLSPSMPSPTLAGKMLPHWYVPWFSRSVPMLGALFFLAILSGGGNIYVRTEGDEAARKWYVASLCFTLVHSLFSLHALEQINAIKKVEGAGEGNLRGLHRWLTVNKWRFLVSEVPAFGAAVIAAGS